MVLHTVDLIVCCQSQYLVTNPPTSEDPSLVKSFTFVVENVIKLFKPRYYSHPVIAERLSARQLILLRMAFCVGMLYVRHA